MKEIRGCLCSCLIVRHIDIAENFRHALTHTLVPSTPPSGRYDLDTTLRECVTSTKFRF